MPRLPYALSYARISCEGGSMTDTISIYFSKGRKGLKGRLARLARKQDRSVNYLVLKAIEEYLEKEEA
jgi:predicted transcriptional regulator